MSDTNAADVDVEARANEVQSKQPQQASKQHSSRFALLLCCYATRTHIHLLVVCISALSSCDNCATISSRSQHLSERLSTSPLLPLTPVFAFSLLCV